MFETINQITLSNTLRLITVPMDTSSVTALVLIGAGSRYEKPEEAGISHFLEHMMFKGTKSRPTSLELVQEVDGMGGEYNAYTSRDYTGYYIKSASKHLSKTLEILSDMTLNSLLLQEEIDREKGVIIQEMMMYEDTPIQRVEEEYEALLYGKESFLGRQIIGTKKTIMSVTHEDFITYMHRLYRPQNATVVIAGGIDSNISSIVERYFGSWKNQKTPQYGKAEFSTDKPRVNIISKKTEQTHLCIGTYAYSRTDTRRYPLNILMAILGGGMSSRLFHQVRERRGLAYYVKSWTNHYQDTGNVVTQAGVDVLKLEEAVRVIVDEFQKISKKGYRVPEDEMVRAKEFMKGHVILSMEDSMNVAQFLGKSALLDNKIRTLKQTLESIDKVTVDDVADISSDLFVKNHLQLAVIGPVKTAVANRLKSLIQ
jgi:predicted Zn-dependent peptidase